MNLSIFCKLTTLVVCFSLSGCVSLAVVGHSRKGSDIRAVEIENVYAAYKSTQGDIILCVNGKTPEITKYEDYSLILSKDLIEQTKKEHFSKHHSDNTARLMPDVRASIGQTCRDKVKSWDRLPISFASGTSDIDIGTSYIDAYPRLHSDEYIYIIPNHDSLVETWGSLRVILSTKYLDGTEIRWEIRGQEVREQKADNSVFLLPITVAIDAATLPLQALWLVASGASMGVMSSD